MIESAAFAIDRAANGEAFDLVPVLLEVRNAAFDEAVKILDSLPWELKSLAADKIRNLKTQ